ncbi:hypothetical protein IWZ03DRAFT_125557 [Phyllosticta citriasiana]|uniref:Nucleoporin NUP37 n=1 Tax=Phyllosticta citriasiana TaxID=595635 RepID=A0ABR1KR75_9PEZI
MATWTEPRTTRHGKQTHLCYDLQHRVNVSKIYPRTAPNGSTVLVYGHTNGIRIIWRRGRALKKKAAAKEHGKPKANGTNGTSSDVVMIDLVSDDESPAQAPPPPTTQDDAEFESEEEDANESEPNAHIVQQLDIPLGTEVLSLALPQLPHQPSYKPVDVIPPIFNEKIVVSAACADTSVRVITLPLTPPSDARKAADRRKVQTPYGEQVLRIEGQHGHQAIPSGITMSWTPNDADSLTEDVDMEDDEDAEDDESEPRPRKRIGLGDVKDWDLVVASHSIEVTGVLHIFRIPIIFKDDRLSLTTKPIFPHQTQYLPTPATHISFTPARFPSRRHLHLLVADGKGFVKIYNPLAAPRARPRSARPGITQVKKSGAWIASFSTGFESVKDQTAHPGLAQRKRILDAKWASDGRSIVVLLADGEWGAWDVDGSGPGSSKTLNFALRGHISISEQKSTSSAPMVPSKTGSRGLALAPMTPNTRRHREESLFYGPVTSATSDIPRGGISVASSINKSSGQSEDALILWYGDDVFRIPNFQQFWQRNSGSSSSSGSLYGPGLTRVESITLNGEPINGVEQFAREGTAARMGVPRDLLIAGSTRLLFVVHATPQTKTSGGLFADRHVSVDNQLLKRGELDLGGMDRILNGMSGEAAPANRNPMLRLGNETAAAANTRKVGFAGLGSSR